MRTRQGFTLIELMVAMVLTIFIMVILTEAFVLSIDTFSALKGIGDMQENLRAGANALRSDLGQDHLEGKRRISDSTIVSQRPREGFFVIFQGGASVPEGLDSDSVPSSRATNHVLQFTSRLRGNQQQSFYSTNVGDASFFNLATFYNLSPATGVDADATLRAQGGPFYRSQWAEIAYFVAATGSTEEPTNPAGAGTPLFGLYRAQFVAVTDPTAANAANYGSAAAFQGLACNVVGNAVSFFGPHQLAKGAATRTFIPATPTARSASLVVPNVISFQVQAIQNGNPGYPGDLSYDSASSPSVLQGVSITIRVWDNKTRQTRQLTVMQDL